MSPRSLVSICVCAIAGCAIQSASADLITNGGFETGDTTGWTVVHTGSFSGVDVGGGTANTGIHWWAMGATSAGDQSDLYQDVPTYVGDVYVASFWAYDENPTGPGTIHVTFGGQEVGPVSGVVTGSYTQYSLTYTATSTTTRLETVGWESVAYVISDDYSVQPAPAPSAAALLGIGGVALTRRRRR